MSHDLIGAAESTAAVPVRGGLLHVGEWHVGQRHSEAAGLPVLAVHGITAHHQSWARVAAHLDGVRVIAPDLRGRGQSRALPMPGRLDDHADDLVAVLDHYGIERAVVVGHSMGGFVTVRLAQRHPERMAAALLVDGGLPLPDPASKPDGSAATADDLLGPAIARLGRTFCSIEEYRAFWQQHPAFGPIWDEWVQAYVDYDLVGVGADLHPSAMAEAVKINTLELGESQAHLAALASIPEGTEVLRVPRGLMNEPGGLYPLPHAEAIVAQAPHLRLRTVADLNHYSILLADSGARAVAASVRATLARATTHLVSAATSAAIPEGL